MSPFGELRRRGGYKRAYPWTQWQGDGWQRLRDERVKAVARCTEKLEATPEKFW